MRAAEVMERAPNAQPPLSVVPPAALQEPFEEGALVRVFPCTFSGLRPRFATGFLVAKVLSFDLETRTYTVVPIAEKRSPRPGIPEGSVVEQCTDGMAFFDRAGRRSSEGAKAVNEALKARDAADAKRARAEVSTEVAKRRAKKATEEKNEALSLNAKLSAQMDALSSGDPNDPRLTHLGRMLAKALTAEAQDMVRVEVRRTDVEEKKRKSAERRAKALEEDLDHIKTLKNAACKRARDA